MEWVHRIFGVGEDLTTGQMALRALVMFIITLVLIRISGRRSFSLHAAPDNIISITLGAVLSRGIVGASPFLSVVAAALVIAVLHRLVIWVSLHNKPFLRLLTGRKILVYKQGEYLSDNMKRALVCREEIIEGVSRLTLTESMDDIDRVYIGNTGEFIVIKK